MSYVSYQNYYNQKHAHNNDDESVLEKAVFNPNEQNSKYPYILLEELEGNLLKDEKLIITKTGLVNSTRNDGLTIFGKVLKVVIFD